MRIEELSKCKGASRFGTCNECFNGSDTHELYRIRFNGVSVCLCREHLKQLSAVVSHFLEESEE